MLPHLFTSMLFYLSYVLQVFQEGATFCGKMKDYCRSIFLQYYSDVLGLNDDIPGQLDYQENISRNVKWLIGRATEFHYGPLDTLVSSHFYIVNCSHHISREKSRILHTLVSGPYVLISSMDLVVDHHLLQRSFRRTFECLYQSMQLQWQ